MILKNVDQITFADIEDLIRNEVIESLTIEYKSQLPQVREEVNEKFLAAISSFANTQGGDLLFGIIEDKGRPISAPGIPSGDIDKEKQRLENIIRDGIEPRINDYLIHPIKISNGNYIILIRINKGWNSPYKVIATSRFYGRHSAGQYPLNVTELRAAFLYTELIPDRIRRFKNDRLSSIQANYELPVALAEDGKIVLHIIPLSSFTDPGRNILPALDYPNKLEPMMAQQTWAHNHNIDGIVTYIKLSNHPCLSYCQLYRAGIIESVMVLPPQREGLILWGEWFDKIIIKYISLYMNELTKVGVNTLFYIFISLVDIKGYMLKGEGLSARRIIGEEKINRDLITTPEIVIQDINDDIPKLVKPISDIIWNAFGYEHSLSYDKSGNLIKQNI